MNHRSLLTLLFALTIALLVTNCGSSDPMNAMLRPNASNVVSPLSTTTGSLTFSNESLIEPEGGSEPEVAIGVDGTMGIAALRFLLFGTNLWTGPAGSSPTLRGVIDAALQPHGRRTALGGGDADVDVASTGTLHETSLIFLVNPPFKAATLGVSQTRCPNAASFDLSACTSRILDQAGADRPWITSEGSHVYIAYHDSGNSSLVHVQRSEDDGLTWTRVGDPIVGHGRVTGSATFNNEAGPIVADPVTHNVYTIYAAGEPGIQKAKVAVFNNIFVSHSTDFGKSWTSVLVFHAPLFTRLNNIFPSLAVDSTNGHLYATWSDGTVVSFSVSTDEGSTWSTPVSVNVAPANTAIFPWIAAHGGTVDVVYYATTSPSNEDGAVWNVYLAQTTSAGASFTQSLVSQHSNHTGVICEEGIACDPAHRTLLDLFKVAINPNTGLAGVVYTDDTISVDQSGNPLPQIVLAQQGP